MVQNGAENTSSPVESTPDDVDWPGRWTHVSKLLERTGALSFPDFEPSDEVLGRLNNAKVLVVGGGGLGCELLKDLGMMGFQNLHVIDMDTIDISNLNRQFLFRKADVGRMKAVVAAEFINKRIPGCSVTPAASLRLSNRAIYFRYACRIEEKDEDFYRSFNIIVCGLDSIQARRWINGMLCDLLDFDEDGNLDPSTVIPLIDGGTEGFQGNARVVYPGLSACIECTLGLYPPQVNFPMCTIAHTPRLPEHCIEYVKLIQWSRDKPFEGAALDGDNPDHVQWVMDRAQERASEFGIQGITYRLTQGVVKHIIPAVASTNAIIAASCALEVFKLASSCSLQMNNYMNYQGSDGVFAGVVALEKKEDCAVCSRKPQHVQFSDEAKLRDVIEYLKNHVDYQMKSPTICHGTRSLYMPSIPQLEEATRPNLAKTLKELNVVDQSMLLVADSNLPRTLEFIITVTSLMDTTD